LIKVSIITVCKNSEDTIEATILSVLEQKYPNIEYIIIDGDSTDNTNNIISKYQQSISKIISEKDQGEYFAMNKGLKMATGDIVGFLCADDTLASNNVINKIVKSFGKDNINIVWGDVLIVSRLDKSKISRYYSGNRFKKNKFKFGLMPPHPSIYIKRELLLKSKGFDVSFKISADFDLISRIITNKNVNSRYIPKIIVYMKSGGVTNSSLKNKLLLNYEIYKSNLKNKITANPFLLLFKVPVRLLELIKKPGHGAIIK